MDQDDTLHTSYSLINGLFIREFESYCNILLSGTSKDFDSRFYVQKRLIFKPSPMGTMTSTKSPRISQRRPSFERIKRSSDNCFSSLSMSTLYDLFSSSKDIEYDTIKIKESFLFFSFSGPYDESRPPMLSYSCIVESWFSLHRLEIHQRMYNTIQSIADSISPTREAGENSCSVPSLLPYACVSQCDSAGCDSTQ